MSMEKFNLVKMGLELVLYALSAVVLPMVFLWIRGRTTREQRREALYWSDFAIQMAERIFKERGMGPIKKDFVLQWLHENGIYLERTQADLLIDSIVDWYNSVDWREKLLGGDENGRVVN